MKARLTLLHVVHLPPIADVNLASYIGEVEAGAKQEMETYQKRVSASPPPRAPCSSLGKAARAKNSWLGPCIITGRAVVSDREVPVDVRVPAATNRDLAAAAEQGTFREDLFYRLKVMTVRVPPLREHPDDIAFLADTFLQRHATEAKGGARRLTRAALDRLEQYCWPGNVRELSHVIERAVTLSDGEWIDEEDVGFEEEHRTARVHDVSGDQSTRLWSEETCNLDVVTRRLIVAALQKTCRHKGQAAALLGVHPCTLTRMMRRCGMPEEDGDGL